MDATGVTGYDYAAFYYDERGRIIQSRTTNHMGGIEEEYVAYNCTGEPLKRQHAHTATGKSTQTEVCMYEYDHAGRLLKTKHKLDTNDEVTLVENTYDEDVYKRQRQTRADIAIRIKIYHLKTNLFLIR